MKVILVVREERRKMIGFENARECMMKESENEKGIGMAQPTARHLKPLAGKESQSSICCGCMTCDLFGLI